MIIRAAAFTERGAAWSETLGIHVERPQSVMEWVQQVFPSCDAILFIGAAGIAVRAIARHIASKLSDPAVLVMDEAGRHIIPILSGHIGGGNELALLLAEKTGAEPVITTATDINGLPAIDVWAKKHGCAIENPSCIKDVSSAVLERRQVGVMITERTLTPPFPVTLTLRPRTLVLGSGCRSNVDCDLYENNALAFLKMCGVSLLSIRAIASADRKANEPAMLRFCEKYGLPFLTYTAEELAATPGVFAHSDYVQKTIGVGNVCERAAVKACGGRLLMGKTKYEGMTFALAGEGEI